MSYNDTTTTTKSSIRIFKEFRTTKGFPICVDFNEISFFEMEQTRGKTIVHFKSGDLAIVNVLFDDFKKEFFKEIYK